MGPNKTVENQKEPFNLALAVYKSTKAVKEFLSAKFQNGYKYPIRLFLFLPCDVV